MTEKLYYENAYLTEFRARVLSSERDGDRFRVILDRTAFYPEGGGERADVGVIGKARVLDVQKEGDEVIHFTDADVSGEVGCEVDFAPRYRMMQNHTAEHICSGTFHRLIGAENVGFHMGSQDVTFDLDREADEETVARAEYMANEAVFRNMEVRAYFPDATELPTLRYRSKGEFAPGAAVRIVEAGDADCCACGALHVRRTGEIGQIRFLSHMRYKGGTRIHMLAGYDALEHAVAERDAVAFVARKLSVKPEELSAGVDVLSRQLDEAKSARAALCAAYSLALVQSAAVGTENARAVGNAAIFFADALNPAELRELANLGAKSYALSLALCPGEGGFSFVLTAAGANAREITARMQDRIPVRGGGKPEMTNGRISASRDEIAAAFFAAASEQ